VQGRPIGENRGEVAKNDPSLRKIGDHAGEFTNKSSCINAHVPSLDQPEVRWERVPERHISGESQGPLPYDR
jgi:hypothetical protein